MNNINNMTYLECTDITDIEQYYIDIYTANVYIYINTFLQGIDTMSTYCMFDTKQFIKYFYFLFSNSNNYNLKNIKNTVNNKLNSGDLEWFRQLMYNYMTRLYTTINKCPKQTNPFILYRGSLTHYLHEDTELFYYLNTFTSTTTDINTSKSFSKKHSKNSNGILYQFMVIPSVSCIYIGEIEDEILLNIYNLYKFIKRKDNILYYYIIPSSIIIPDSYNKFMNFKKSIVNKKESISGGYIMDSKYKYNTIKNITPKIKLIKINKTRKNKKTAMKNHFRERMNLPIGTSSKGITGTKEMNSQIDYLKKYFNM